LKRFTEMKSLVTIILLFMMAASARGQEIQVPVDQQVPLLLKILCFDRNLHRHADKQFVFAILYQKKFRKSLDAKNDFEQALSKYSLTKIDNIPIKLIAVDVSEDSSLTSIIDYNRVDVIYLAPVKAINIGDITTLSRQKQITTLTGVADYVEAGIAVGVGVKGDKPQILINLNAAKAEGVNFNSQLLKLARIVE
jgi:hypothetical protein